MYDLNHFEAHIVATKQDMPKVAAREYADALRSQTLIRQELLENSARRRFVERLLKHAVRAALRPLQRWNLVPQ